MYVQKKKKNLLCERRCKRGSLHPNVRRCRHTQLSAPLPRLGAAALTVHCLLQERDLATRLPLGFVLTLVEKHFPGLNVYSAITYKGISFFLLFSFEEVSGLNSLQERFFF